MHHTVAHCATVLVEVRAEVAFAFMADPLSLGAWSLGCMRIRATDEKGVYTGVSLFDDSQAWVRLEPHPELLLIDYLVGTAGDLKSRISARIVAGEACEMGTHRCYVSLFAWRPATMSDERWQRLCASHDAEIWLIKSRLQGPGPTLDRYV